MGDYRTKYSHVYFMQLNKWGKDLTVEEAENLGLIQKSEPTVSEPKVTTRSRRKKVTENDNNTTN
jgi:hypothetical protein